MNANQNRQLLANPKHESGYPGHENDEVCHQCGDCCWKIVICAPFEDNMPPRTKCELFGDVMLRLVPLVLVGAFLSITFYLNSLD
jgi:uncharacterized cysteine cluster protein YcgN (CxxCxxCC family)